MTTTDKRKRSLYFPDTILREMQSEAKRQERSLSWIVQYAWRIARAELMRLPSVGNGGQNFHDDDEADAPLEEIGPNLDRPHANANPYSPSGFHHSR